MTKITKTETSLLASILGTNIFRNEQNQQSRLLSHLVQACWKFYGSDQARVMLYSFGRIAGLDLCANIAQEYAIDQEMNWSEFLESIEVLGKLFLKASVKVVSSQEDKVLIRVTDSPCCHKLTGYDEPCCDFLAGLFASFGSYVFSGVETTCNELVCKATNFAQYCDFELKFNWAK
jgi:predicted hydrocarbon binding protein